MVAVKLLQLNMTKLLSPVENAICWYFSIPLPATIPEMYHMGARTVGIDNGGLDVSIRVL